MFLHFPSGLTSAPFIGARGEEKCRGCVCVSLFLGMVWAKPSSVCGFRRTQMPMSLQRVDFGTGLVDVVFSPPVLFFPLFLWVKGMEGDTVSLSSSSQPCLLLTHHRGGEGQRQGQMDSPRRSLTLGKGNRCRTQAGLRDLAGEADNIPVHTYNMYTHI